MRAGDRKAWPWEIPAARASEGNASVLSVGSAHCVCGGSGRSMVMRPSHNACQPRISSLHLFNSGRPMEKAERQVQPASRGSLPRRPAAARSPSFVTPIGGIVDGSTRGQTQDVTHTLAEDQGSGIRVLETRPPWCHHQPDRSPRPDCLSFRVFVPSVSSLSPTYGPPPSLSGRAALASPAAPRAGKRLNRARPWGSGEGGGGAFLKPLGSLRRCCCGCTEYNTEQATVARPIRASAKRGVAETTAFQVIQAVVLSPQESSASRVREGG